MGARTDTRDRMIDAAKTGFRTHGVTATSFSDVLARAGAARGAIYHHFPGGRKELTIAVVSSTADNIAAALDRSKSAVSPREDFEAAAAALIATVEGQAGGFGCPITPAVLDAAGDADLLAAAHSAFERWRHALVEHHGLSVGAAALVVSAIEGALVLCRAAQSAEPLHSVVGELAQLFSAQRDGPGDVR